MDRLMKGLAVAIAAAAIGCGGDGGGTSVVTCELQDLPGTHWCYEIASSTLPAQQISALEAACAGLTGQGETVLYKTNQACPASAAGGNRVGVCALTSSASVPWWYGGLPTGISVKVSYYDPPVTSTMGESICADSNGTWTQ